MKNILSQIVGALAEAWGEVKVQKARVILSLVGVVAAVAAMTTVVALGQLMQQSLAERQEAFEGRSVTLDIRVNKRSEEGDSAAVAAGSMWAEGMPPGEFMPMGDPAAASRQGAENHEPHEDAHGKPIDPVGNAMQLVAERFKIPYWARVQDGMVELREYMEASRSGFFRGQPIIMSEFNAYEPPMLKAVDPNYQVIYRLQLVAGRWLHPDDWQQRVAPVVVNEIFWDRIGRPDIQDPVVLHANDDSGKTFRIVGVVKAKAPWESPQVFVHYTGWLYMNSVNVVDGYSVQPALLVWVGEEQLEDARRMVPAAVASVLGPQWEGEVFGGDGFDFGRSELQTINKVIMAIGSIVIFLGALGLLNVAIVTVRQRIREIGIRRAMGASAKRVFFAVFMESVVATFVAGVIGVAIAVVILRLIPLEALDIVLQDQSVFPMTAALAGVTISSAVGALCGIIPAVAAIRVKPIDAIRY